MRTKREAIAFVRHQSEHGPRFDAGLCKRQTRIAYGIPSDGSDDAAEAWTRTHYRLGSGVWVPGAFAWWTGGSHGHGHVAFCAFKFGHVWSVDAHRSGYWDRVPFARIEAWAPSLTFRGFTLDIDGKVPVRIPTTIRRFQP